MKFFLKVLAGNLVLSKGPQDYPFSLVLMKLCLLAYFLTGLPGLSSSAELDVAIIAMALDTLVLLVFIYLCLQAFSKGERFVQTVISLASTGAVFQIAVLPLLFNIPAEPEISQDMLSLSLLLLMFVSWNLAVYAHIFREAFSIRLPSAMLLTISFVIITVVVRKLALPDIGQ